MEAQGIHGSQALLWPLMMLVNGPVVDAVMDATDSCGKACSSWQQEVFSFTSMRLQRDRDWAEAFTRSQSWQDAAKMQQEWAATAIEDFAHETEKLLKIAADAGAKIARTPVMQALTEVSQATGTALEARGRRKGSERAA